MDSAQLEGRTILVVEDEPLVGLEMVETLTASGAHVVYACRVAEAIKSVGLCQITAAVLDIKLGGNDCSVLCHHLSQREIPFVFYTGYTTPPDGWSDVPIITKPAQRTQLVDAIKRLCGSPQHAQ